MGKWKSNRIGSELACLRVITRTYPSEYSKQRQELVNWNNIQTCIKFLKENLAINW